MNPQDMAHKPEDLAEAVSRYLAEARDNYLRDGYIADADDDIDLLAMARCMMNLDHQDELAGLKVARIASCVNQELNKRAIRSQIEQTLARISGNLFKRAGLLAPTLIDMAASDQIDLAPEPVDISIAALLISRTLAIEAT